MVWDALGRTLGGSVGALGEFWEVLYIKKLPAPLGLRLAKLEVGQTILRLERRRQTAAVPRMA